MILGIVQARTSSSRLPRKVLLPILGEPMIFRQMERLKDSKRVTKWILATSSDVTDSELVKECSKRGISHFAGNLNDVLDRFYQAAKPHAPELIVRVTGDCPIIDPEIIDQLIEFHISNKFEYSSNALEPTFPDGLDCEVMTWNALQRAWKEATIPSDREHVTPFIYKDYLSAPRFKIGILKSAVDHSALRWTVDEPKDFELISRIYEGLYPTNRRFRFPEVLEFIRSNPLLSSLNKSITRNEGYLKSLAADDAISGLKEKKKSGD